MAFFYGGKYFDKRGCYVILPVSPFGRFDSNDNTAEVDEEIEVLEGPEVEIVDSFDDSINCKLDMESNNTDSENISTKDASADHATNSYQPGTEPDNKYYEVEAIIAGPKKRREHLFKLCYKVRWKGYGPEADTWQPLADLANVQDMIEEFKKEKAVEAKKRKQKPAVEAPEPKEIKEQTSDSNSPSDMDNEAQQYDPEYGTVKDKFWKDLELGRVDHYSDLFSGDMYSKIKGCQRTAHAEAVANIHKQQSHGKPSVSPLTVKPLISPPAPKAHSSRRHRGALNTSLPKSSPTTGATRSQLSPGKSRKRSCEPFSAKGYTSSKRSRRSRELKSGNMSPEKKRVSISSVTSETIGVVTTTSPVLTPPVVPNSRTATFFSQEPGVTTITYSNTSLQNYKPSDDDEEESEGNSRMTVTSETMLTVTTETKLLDMNELLLSDDATPTNESVSCATVKCINGAASSNDSLSDFQEASGATSSENMSAPKDTNQRSTLDTQSEACGAVERTHDQECLWGGACNRSDCRANRRRNMKNGKEQAGGGPPHIKDESPHSPQNSQEHGSENVSQSAGASTDKTSGTFRDNSLSQSRNCTADPGNTSPMSKPESSIKSHRHSFSSTGVNMKKSSTPVYSSDSSFEEALHPSVPLNREALKSSFSHLDPQAPPLHLDSTYIRNSSAIQPGTSETCTVPSGVRKNSDLTERPGLFSDSAFSFMAHDFGRALSQTVPLPTSGINLSSPGKENFGNSTVSKSGSRDRLHGIMEVDSMEPQFESSVPSQSRSLGESQEMRARKRMSELSQPLEKIPSPNSRRDSDLDRRISTLTCDELEDLVEQGEERLSSKEVGFVTNADLLQAVNLGKAEVVKRAIRQSSMSEKKLDFEQPDNTGLTLLMRAVQKGSLAIVEMLLEHGVDVNAQQTNGNSALMLAAEQNGVCLVALLLKYGANSSLYTVHSDQAETALMKAIKRQHREVVNLMLRVGVNIAAPNCTSISALELAIERRNPQIEALVSAHYQRLEQAFRSRVLVTLEETAQLLEPLFPLQCFPLRESQEFVVKFNSNIHPVAQGEGFLLFIAHTKINDKGVRCRFHGSCPIGAVTLNGVKQTPLTKEVNFLTSCHPIIPGCNTLIIHKLEDYTSKAKLIVQAFRAKLLPC
uniref:Chromo domain-containing protein n=1 Tax=Biomphalaria glabrata TaxID=6526 RepID=A0A2C9M0Z7_BIOGL